MLRNRRAPDPSQPASSSPAASTGASARRTSARLAQKAALSQADGQDDTMGPDERRHLVDGDSSPGEETEMASGTWARRNQWVVLALASGACAAFNGVFAKLTTTELTSTFAKAVASFLHLSSAETVIEVVVRASFFGLNLVFNGVMWTLFTQALARGHSTTQVSIMNTSSNFVLTALLGFAIFSESLPPLWWVGAAMLVGGNVIIGSKDESPAGEAGEEAGTAAAEDGLGRYGPLPPVDPELPNQAKDNEEEDIIDLGDLGPDSSAER